MEPVISKLSGAMPFDLRDTVTTPLSPTQKVGFPSDENGGFREYGLFTYLITLQKLYVSAT
jgi:hypothetical protein